MTDSEDSIESYWEVIHPLSPITLSGYRPTQSIESYWEVIRPHLIKRARQRRLDAERQAEKHRDLKEIFERTWELKNKYDYDDLLFYKIVESQVKAYKILSERIDGYRIKW